MLMSSIVLLPFWSLMYIDESRNIPVGPACCFFAANFSWQMLPLQKHSYKLYLLQTTSTKLMHPTGHLTYQVTSSGNKHKLLPWVSCIIKSSVSTSKMCIWQTSSLGILFYTQFRQLCQVQNPQNIISPWFSIQWLKKKEAHSHLIWNTSLSFIQCLSKNQSLWAGSEHCLFLN